MFDPHYPDPTPGPGEVLVRVHLAGICATDLEIVRGYMAFAGVPGHEFVGRVVIGPPALLGRRVVAEINCAPAPPDTAPPVLDGDARKHLPGRTVLGIVGRDGAMAELLAVPAQNCHLVPDSLRDEQAVFVEPLAAACQVVSDHPVDACTRAAVLGSGRLGILCAQVLAAAGCAPVVLGRNAGTLRFCRALGLDARPAAEAAPRADFDLVVECTGAADGLRLAMNLVRPRGTIVLKSTYAEPPAIDLSPIVIHEITLAGNRCGPFAEALSLLERGAVEVEKMVTGVFPLREGAAAFAAARDPKHIKVLVAPGQA